MAGKRNLLARCVLMAGSPTAAILLYRICYWHPYRKVEAGGELWVAKARAEWMDETGLTLEQYKSAAATLQKRQLVIIQQRKYGTRTISFARLSVRGEEVLSGSLPKIGPEAVESNDTTQVEANDATGEVVNTPPGWGQNTPPYIMGDTVIGDTITEILQGEAYDLTAESEQKNTETGTKPLDSALSPDYPSKGTEAPMVTIQQLKEQGGKAHKPKTLSVTVKKAKLEKLWLTALAELTGKFVAPLTSKDKGQLALIEKQCGSFAEKMLPRVVKDWSAFADSVKASAGLKTIPAMPHIGFLLSQVAAAVMFCQTTEDATNVPKIAKAAKPQAQVPTGPKKPSLEEVMKILSGDDDE